jgi:hypothetical protein
MVLANLASRFLYESPTILSKPGAGTSNDNAFLVNLKGQLAVGASTVHFSGSLTQLQANQTTVTDPAGKCKMIVSDAEGNLSR